MRILLVGDTHGELKDIQKAIFYAQKVQADRIIQLGDFGFFPNLDPNFINQIQSPIPLWFVDGNHEDHEILQSLNVSEPYSLENIPSCVDSYNVYWVPRGYVEIIEGKEILYIGGADSPDIKHRVPGRDWWPEETVTYNNVVTALSNACNPTIVFSHDSPGTTVSNKYGTSPSREALHFIFSQFSEIKMWFHGHHHVGYSQLVENTVVRGLGIAEFHILDLDVVNHHD